MSAIKRARQQFTQQLHVVERRRAQLEPPGRLLAARHQEVPVRAERVLGPRVGVALRHLEHLRQPHVDRPARQRGQPFGAHLGQVERHAHLVEQAFESGPGSRPRFVSRRAACCPARRRGEAGLVAAQVEVDAAGARPIGPEAPWASTCLGRSQPGRCARVRAWKISLPLTSRSMSGSLRRTASIASRTPAYQPSGRSSLRPPTRLNMKCIRPPATSSMTRWISS